MFALAGTVIWVLLLFFPTSIADTEVDPCWGQSLGYFLKHHFQAGQQYVFTYGPLGYFTTPMYDSELFWLKVAWELILKFLMVLTALRLTRQTLTVIPRLIFCLGIAIFHVHFPDGPYAFFLFLLAASLMAGTEQFSRKRLAVDTFLLATIALVKINVLVQAVVIVAATSGRLLAHQPRWRALLPPALFGIALLSWWLVLGQSVANFPSYVKHSLEIATGYNDAMGLPGERGLTVLGVAVLGLLGVSVCSRSFFQREGVGNALAAGVVSLYFFFEWKHGFVRQDMHQIIFFSMTLLCPFLFPAVFPTYRWRRGPRPVLVGGALLLSAVGFLHVFQSGLALGPKAYLAWRVASFFDRARLALHPGQLRDQMERSRAELARRYALPRIAARIGDASVDAFSYEQGVVLLNRLNWVPRPIFQAYSAYTAHLQAINARFLAGANAPEYLIFQLLGFDGRLPVLEDGQALLQIIQRYHPVLAEGANLLLERNGADAGDQPPTWTPLREQVIHFDEEVAIDDRAAVFQRLKVQLGYSWVGQVRKALYKPPQVSIKLRTANQEVFTYRLIPDIAASGFLLNPFLRDTWDLVDLYGKGPTSQVTAFWITTDRKSQTSFANPIRITLEGASRLPATELTPGAQQQLRFPMMPTRPDEVVVSSVAPQTERYQDLPVLLLHPESEMRFRVAPGQRHVRGQFGILPQAYEQGRTDGVRFRIEFHPDQGGSPAILWERTLDPRHQAADRGFQQVDFRAPVAGAGRLILRTSARPGKSPAWCWSFWTEVEIQ